MSPRTLQRTLTSAGALLAQRGLALSTAESCTGGMIGAAITSIAGSSQYYRGGVIAYENAVKHRVLGVSQRVLDKHGAVSRATVLAMARGVRKLLRTGCSIAVSGIAGPAGGSAEKPVGLVWIAVSVLDKTDAWECRFSGGREAVRRATVEEGMRKLVQMLVCVHAP